jgi:sigma-54 dependent transcriptional regulator, flagellar regulatory protein
MPEAVRLAPREREFFGGLVRVIFSNPFATEPAQLRPLVGRARLSSPGDHPLAALGPAVERKLRDLESRGAARLTAVEGEDRRLLEWAFLFQAYDRFVDPFDALILEQIDRGDEPAAAPFTGDLMALLARRGFPDEDAARLVSLFFQVRRAYFFIARSLTGDSASMKALRRALWDSVFTSDILAYRDHLWNRMEDFSTLLLGETGTGKGSAAAAIGRSGLIPFDPRTRRFARSFTGTFIAINLSQFPETLIESELFGHRKGAFTGAVEDHQGIFERCSPHGSLFLDEIGDLSVPVQIKLLNVIQDRVFSPVGSRRQLRFAGRLIAATNRPLAALRREGRFRDDFFYRLSSDVIEVPPLRRRLREHPGELDQLVELLLERITGRPSEELRARVITALKNGVPAGYAWPGNVRELEQALRRILLKGTCTWPEVPSGGEEEWLEQAREGSLSGSELLRRYCRMLHARHGTYEAVAARTGLDRRTVRRHVAPKGSGSC